MICVKAGKNADVLLFKNESSKMYSYLFSNYYLDFAAANTCLYSSTTTTTTLILSFSWCFPQIWPTTNFKPDSWFRRTAGQRCFSVNSSRLFLPKLKTQNFFLTELNYDFVAAVNWELCCSLGYLNLPISYLFVTKQTQQCFYWPFVFSLLSLCPGGF